MTRMVLPALSAQKARWRLSGLKARLPPTILSQLLPILFSMAVFTPHALKRWLRKPNQKLRLQSAWKVIRPQEKPACKACIPNL
jgi:hypothetical protein